MTYKICYSGAEMTLHYLTTSELELSREEVNLQIALGLESCKTKEDVCELLEDVRAHERYLLRDFMKTKRYQDHPLYLRWIIWIRWMPYAFIRGALWYIAQAWSKDKGKSWGLHSCIDFSIGDIQATKMHWVYSGEECMRMSKR